MLPEFCRPQRLAALAMLATATLAGCGGAAPTGDVNGAVTLDGKPLEGDLMVTLFDVSTGRGASVDVREGGVFEVPDPLPVGTYKVFMTPAPPPEPKDGSPPPPVRMDGRIPERYLNEVATDIEVEVREGNNAIEVPLVSG